MWDNCPSRVISLGFLPIQPQCWGYKAYALPDTVFVHSYKYKKTPQGTNTAFAFADV